MDEESGAGGTRPTDIQLDIATSEMDRNVESPKIEPEEEIS